MESIPDPPGHGGAIAGPEGGGDYQTGLAIREGWGGTIHDGTYRRSGLRVTLQDVRPDLASTPGFIDRLDRFGRDAAAVRDAHLLAVYDLVEVGGAYRLVAEWCDGVTLAATLQRGSLPPAEAVATLGDVMTALVALHSRGLFHGQIGPQTVVIDGRGRARLAELAICAAAAQPGFGPQTDVRDAARLGMHLLRTAGNRFDAVRRPLDAAASGSGAGNASRLREELEAAAAVVLGAGWRAGDAGPAPRAQSPGRRRRRLGLAALAVLVVAAAVATGVVLLANRTAVGPASTAPLAVGANATLGVTPASAGCNTTFSFIARGSLTGTGTLVYRWEQSDGQVTGDTSLPITANEGAFQLTQAWRLQGSQKVSGTMTLHIVKPVDRKISQAFAYSCP